MRGPTSAQRIHCFFTPLVLLATTPAWLPAEQPHVFESRILPFIEGKCIRCHGGETRKAQLDLRTVASMLEGGESGPAIVPGNAEESLLLEMLVDEAMPPEGEPLTPAQVDEIRQWIQSGASSQSGGAPESVGVTQHDAIPILLRRCTMCHGPEYQEGGLDLRSRETILSGGKSGPAMVPGDPAQSRFIQRIANHEMPPESAFGQAGIEPMTEDELEVLREWVSAGAPVIDAQPDVATSAGDPVVSDDDRQFWSFQPPQDPRVPAVDAAEQANGPIDAFLLARLKEHGLTFSPAANRHTLIRRITYDLTGLGPDPDDVFQFIHDDRPDAHERLADRLIASPRYGERWGRVWLDLAGYADSEGKRQADTVRPYAYRYRDYVIRSLNHDLPYDRFLTEQIAGDELVDYGDSTEISEDVIEKLVATGFLRMVPDGTSANPVNRVIDRFEVLADAVDVVGRGVMGMTMNCARCHSHKYDPIPQRDYYRFVAIFKGAYDEYDWMTPQPFNNQWKNSQQRVLAVSTAAEKSKWEQTRKTIQRDIDALELELKQLKAASPQTNAVKTRVGAVKKAISAFEVQLKGEPKIRALWDRGRPSPTYIYRRGDPAQPTRLVGPGVPSVLTDGKTPFIVQSPAIHAENEDINDDSSVTPAATKTGRRLAFARWLTQPDHPLTARVMVNRVWKNRFGRGIVRSLDNFGRTGTPPTHPQLLDWLARRFVNGGWSIKSLHRTMLNSTAYRQSSAIRTEHLQKDPENQWLSRMPMRRMDAEEVRDSLIQVAGRLNERPFGRPDQVVVRQQDGLITARKIDGGWRRSVYVRQRRKEMPTIFETFDLPQMNPNCHERIHSTIVSQPLHLMNNEMIHDLAGLFGQRVREEAGPNPHQQITRAYLIAFGRPPSGEELVIGQEALVKLTQQWIKSPASSDMAPAQRALADYCHALINSASLLYID